MPHTWRIDALEREVTALKKEMAALKLQLEERPKCDIQIHFIVNEKVSITAIELALFDAFLSVSKTHNLVREQI